MILDDFGWLFDDFGCILLDDFVFLVHCRRFWQLSISPGSRSLRRSSTLFSKLASRRGRSMSPEIHPTNLEEETLITNYRRSQLLVSSIFLQHFVGDILTSSSSHPTILWSWQNDPIDLADMECLQTTKISPGMAVLIRGNHSDRNKDTWITDWWFGTFFMFQYIGNNHPNWLIFFRALAQGRSRRSAVHADPLVGRFVLVSHGFVGPSDWTKGLRSACNDMLWPPRIESPHAKPRQEGIQNLGQRWFTLWDHCDWGWTTGDIYLPISVGSWLCCHDLPCACLRPSCLVSGGWSLFWPWWIFLPGFPCWILRHGRGWSEWTLEETLWRAAWGRCFCCGGFDWPYGAVWPLAPGTVPWGDMRWSELSTALRFGRSQRDGWPSGSIFAQIPSPCLVDAISCAFVGVYTGSFAWCPSPRVAPTVHCCHRLPAVSDHPPFRQYMVHT